jgi:serine/threonine protein kinase
LIRKKSFDEVIQEQRGWVSARRGKGVPLRGQLSVSNRSELEFRTPFETYRATGNLGQGGSGIVVSAQDESGELYAIKYLRAENVTKLRRKRFRNEIRFGQRINHPNIVPILDVGSVRIGDADVLFYVMPLYASTLRRVMSATPSSSRALTIFEALLSGIEAAHAAGVFHRDLKPENILLSHDMSDVRIADFGIAHFSEEALFTSVETRDQERLANFVYAAPEQRVRSASIDHRADFFALGLMLNELLTGEIPHGGGYKRISAAHSGLAQLDRVVDLLIRQRPEDRPSSTAEIRRLLDA